MNNEKQRFVEIRVWMMRAGIKPAQIKKDLELNSTSAVTHFVNGDQASRPIAAYLVGKGCPKEIVNVKTGRVAA